MRAVRLGVVAPVLTACAQAASVPDTCAARRTEAARGVNTTLTCGAGPCPASVKTSAAIRRTTDAALHRLRQWEAQGAIFLNRRGGSAGNGGQAYTDELPQPDYAGRPRLKDRWGNSMAQIFVGVSPDMHEEFSLRYEIELLEHFGLNCYGCCEPLHRKIHMVEKIPRLRRISMSPWVDWEEGARAIAGRFVYSAKPNPAFLAAETLDLEPARRELIRILTATRGQPVELVLKDIHTLRGEPRRLTAWAEMAMATVREYGEDP